MKELDAKRNITDTILIIEDDLFYGKILYALIESEFPGYKIAHFDHPNKALESTLLYARVEYIFFDLYYQSVSQISSIESLLDKYHNALLFVQSSSQGVNDLISCIEYGASGYILKSEDEEEIRKSIRIVKAEEAIISPVLAKKLIQKFSLRKKQISSSQDLTVKEEKTLSILALGLSYQESAELLDISINGLRSRIRKIYEKLNVTSRVAAIRKYENRK